MPQPPNQDIIAGHLGYAARYSFDMAHTACSKHIYEAARDWVQLMLIEPRSRIGQVLVLVDPENCEECYREELHKAITEWKEND